MAHISHLRCRAILVANDPIGQLILDACFDATRACCVDDGQYWFTDPEEFPIVEETLRKYGINYSFKGEA